ncbi:hypothetical protein [Alkalihalobacterium elongatum]|uniref:hypothetical protein n=1 Tax=Alkalihalobacterium elongatum TaxID=2675466 RepID=UPI001C1F5936|nr:hypothetical protein [Alkalihalobacterium elongatum]
MKNLFITSIFIMIMILGGCSNEEVTNYEYTFIGEGEFWEAEYIYKGAEIWGEEEGVTTYSNEANEDFRITYKGSPEDIQTIENLEFSYDARASGGSRSREFDEPPNDITFSTSGRSTGAKVQEDEVIKVNVKWDDFEDSFELINKEK